MSVINQMLQDLDKRKAKQQAPELDAFIQNIASPQCESASSKANNKVTLLAIILSVFTLLAASYYLGSTQRQVDNKQAISNIASAKTPVQALATTTLATEPAVEVAIKDEPTMNNQRGLVQASIKETKDGTEIKAMPILAQPEKRQALPRSLAKRPVITGPVAKVHKIKSPATRAKGVQTPHPKAAPLKNQPRINEEQQQPANLDIQRTHLDIPTLIAQEQKKAELAKSKRDLQLARQHLQRILKLDPTQNKTRSELASLYFGSGKIEQAISSLEQGLVISPDYAQFRLLLSRLFIKQNNYVQAYYYLKPLRPPVKSNVEYHAMLAALAQRNNDNQVAQASYLALVKNQPQKAQWWLGLGISQDSLGLKEKARISYQQAQLMGQLSNSSRVYIENRLKVLEPRT